MFYPDVWQRNPAEHETWGAASIPTKAAEELELYAQLPHVPKNGIVVDIGAGAGQSLEAAIHTERPDIRIIAVDPGYSLGADPDELAMYRYDISECFSEQQRARLRSSTIWHSRKVAGYAEALPLRSGVADLVVSYAAVPEYTEHDRSLTEVVRVLKLGGTALLGPLMDEQIDSWRQTVETAHAAGEIKDFSLRRATIVGAYGQLFDTFITTLKK